MYHLRQLPGGYPELLRYLNRSKKIGICFPIDFIGWQDEKIKQNLFIK